MKVGDTVSLRVVTPAGPTDVVGTLLAASADALTVRRRDGSVADIPAGSVRAARVVPPGPARTIGVADLQRVMARGWRAPEEELLGDWLLRAAGGVTSRANSALAVGDPGRPLPAAVDAVQGWYADRELVPRVQLPGDGATAGLAELLDGRGWSASAATSVLTAELAHVLRAAPAGPAVDVRLEETLDDAWFAAWRIEEGEHPDAARALLANHDRVVFASVRDAGRCVAIARATVDGRWAGLFSVEVAADRRRQGLGRAVSLAALRWAGRHGGRHCYLQAVATNDAAITLYESLGFATHHDYVYRIGSVGT